MKDQDRIERAISERTGERFQAREASSIGGGCINEAVRVSDGERRYFVKRNKPSLLDAFEAEAQALDELAATETLRVPRPLSAFATDESSYLILEYIEPGRGRGGDWAAMGRQLAALHAIRRDRYGWSRDNYIGSSPQPNALSDDWTEFFRERRLAHMFRLCRERGHRFADADRLLERIPDLIGGHEVWPSLLHGDLWSGNAAFDADGQPFFFDPASYWGDREADLAFTEFFGGYAPAFYDAYREALPLDGGYERRKTLYNLYHCLNHAYLFGANYAREAESMMQTLLRE